MTNVIHQARLALTSAVADAEFCKKLIPTLTNTPDLPAIDWSQIGQSAPSSMDTLTGLLTAMPS